MPLTFKPFTRLECTAISWILQMHRKFNTKSKSFNDFFFILFVFILFCFLPEIDASIWMKIIRILLLRHLQKKSSKQNYCHVSIFDIIFSTKNGEKMKILFGRIKKPTWVLFVMEEKPYWTWCKMQPASPRTNWVCRRQSGEASYICKCMQKTWQMLTFM